jgi:outer membrane protein insertion porin family
MIRHHKNCLLLFLIGFLSAQTLPQTIGSIEITGNETFSNETFLRWIQLPAGSQVFSGITDTIESRIKTNLSNEGFFKSEVRIVDFIARPDSQKASININVKEGPEAVIESFNLFYENFEEKLLLDKYFEKLQGKRFSKQQIEASIFSALTFLEDYGYPFGRIFIASINMKEEDDDLILVEINLKVKSGGKQKIKLIETAGNSKTKDYVIIRELRLQRGEHYSQKRINEFPKRLNRLRFFEPVVEPEFYLNSAGEGVLKIQVREKQTNNFDGILGYIPAASAGGKGYFTGMVNITLRNLFGTGRAAALSWQQLDRNSQQLELKYLEPWLFGFPFNINLALFQRKQDTSYVQRKVEGALDYLATEDISASLMLASEEVIPSVLTVPVFTVFKSNLFTTGIGLKIDTRDDPYAPTEGIYFLTSYNFSQKKISGPAEFITSETKTKINLQRIALHLNLFYEIFLRNVLALSLNGKELRASLIDQSDLFKLGGTNTLRGYREDQFLGSRIMWTNLEYRLLLTKRSYTFLFFDTGYYLRNAEVTRNIPKLEAFNYGYGLGLNIETDIGVIGVSFALGKGDSFSEGKIHFGLINEF